MEEALADTENIKTKDKEEVEKMKDELKKLKELHERLMPSKKLFLKR